MSKYKFKFFRWVTKFFPVSVLKRVFGFFDHYFIGMAQRIDKNHVFLSAAAIAFSLVLSMIPMVLMMFAVLGNIIEPGNVEDQVNKLIDTLIPYPQFAAYTKKFILSRIPEVIEFKTLAGYLGAFGLLFTSTWLFSTMRTVLNKTFGVSEEKSAWIGLLRDFGMVLLLIIFILLSTFILPISNIIISAADEIEVLKVFQISGLADTLFSILSPIIIFLLFLVFYYLIPYEKLGRKVPIVSAFWATVLWEAARSIFGYYVRNFLVLNKVYGAFVLIIVVMFWIFYSSILFIIGAEIGQLFRERRMLRAAEKSR
ncbi:MAG: YihY/virulence factor BrkB family protein [Ignavibacteriae bacterium]|nr:YihY/virulence factor BrkB family protein [Ignavibacteriota bacterium]NOG99016.1 YihY/virulence factor BrkB family protein [Ignavibacteriota bacterium]